jgi:hypothetical protein
LLLEVVTGRWRHGGSSVGDGVGLALATQVIMRPPPAPGSGQDAGAA